MKFIHLADLHLGKSVNEFSMIEDQRYILNQIINIIREKEIEGVLIAGDVYDRSVPSEEAVRLFNEFLTELAEMKKEVFVISGNHDSDVRLDFGSSLLETNHIFIAGSYGGEIKKVDLEDEFGPLHVWLMPYVKASHVRHYFPDADTSTYDAALRTAVAQCEVNSDERNVILSHQFVTGKSGTVELAGSEMAVVNVGTVDNVGYDCFDAFDYVALGHIHGCQAVGRETCRYAGSPLKYSLNNNELSKGKTVPVITMEEKGKTDIELVDLKPMRDVRRIKGKLEDLLKNAVDTKDYIYATLTDEETQFDAMSRIREVYPDTMKLDYDNTSTRKLKEEFDDIEVEGKTFEELVQDFFELIHARAPEEKEWEIISEVAKEAGVIE